MITDYTPGEFLTYEEYELVFDDGHNNGFAFPCDESGHLLSSATEAAVENLSVVHGASRRFCTVE